MNSPQSHRGHKVFLWIVGLILMMASAAIAGDSTLSFRYLGFSADVNSLQSCSTVSAAAPASFTRSDVLGGTASPLLITACQSAPGKTQQIGICRICRPDLSSGVCPAVQINSENHNLAQWDSSSTASSQCKLLNETDIPEIGLQELLNTSGMEQRMLSVDTVTRASTQSGANAWTRFRRWLSEREHRLLGDQSQETHRTWLRLSRQEGKLFVTAAEPAVVLSTKDVVDFSRQNPLRVRLGFDPSGSGNEPVVIDFAASRDGLSDKPALRSFSIPLDILSTQDGSKLLRRDDGSMLSMPAVLAHKTTLGHFSGEVLIEVREDRFPSLLIPVLTAALCILLLMIFLRVSVLPNKVRIGIVLASVAILCCLRSIAGALHYADDPSSVRRYLELVSMTAEIVLIPFAAFAAALAVTATTAGPRRWIEAAISMVAGVAGWALVFVLLAPQSGGPGATSFLVSEYVWFPIALALVPAGYLAYVFAKGDDWRRWLPLLLPVALRAAFIGERAFGVLLDAFYLPCIALLLAAAARRCRSGMYVLAFLFVAAILLITAAVINDWGLLFIFVLFALMLLTAGSGYLQRSGLPRTTLAALALAALLAWVVLFPLPLYTELTTRFFAPMQGQSGTSDRALRYVKASNNTLRLLFYSNRHLLEQVPARRARAVLEDQWEIEQGIQPLRLTERGRLWWGSGYNFNGASRLYGRRVADDLLLWFYIRGPLGVPGILLLFGLYGAILAAVAYHNRGNPLAIHAAAWITALGWFMIGGTIGANPFSGKWIPFLHLSSSSERMLSFLLLSFLLCGLLESRPVEGRPAEKQIRSSRWSLWFSGLVTAYMLLSILLEPRRFQQTTLDSSKEWQAPEHLFAAMEDGGWQVQCLKIDGINSCGVYHTGQNSPLCALAREGKDSCEQQFERKEGPPENLKEFVPYWNGLSESSLLSRIYSYQEDNLPRIRTPLKFKQADDSRMLSVAGSQESIGSVRPAFLAMEIRSRKKYSGPACVLRSDQQETTLQPGTGFDLCHRTNTTAAPGALTFQCGEAPVFHIYSLNPASDAPSAWLLFNVFHERQGAPNFDLQWGSSQIRAGQMMLLRFDHPEDPGIRIVKTDFRGKQTASWTLRWTRAESGNTLARSMMLNGRPTWNYDPLNRWWMDRVVGGVSDHLRQNANQSLTDAISCEKSDGTGDCIVRFTLDNDLNRALTGTLEQFMEQDQEPQVRNHLSGNHRMALGARLHETGHIDAPQRASVAIVDIASGEVYAAASYPSGNWLDSEMRVPGNIAQRFLGTAPTVQLREAFDARVRRLVADEGNQNFVTSVIGSAWKPLLLGSLTPDSVDGIQDHAAQLFSLQIQPHIAGEIADVQKNEDCSDPLSECILGLPMWPYGIESAGRHGSPQERIDSRSFIVDSCNKYAITLGTLSLCDWSQQTATMPPCFWAERRDTYWIQGHEYDALPAGCDRAFEYPRKTGDASCSGNITFRPAQMPESPLGRRVASVFNVRVYTPTTESQERYDSSAFNGLFRATAPPGISVLEQTNLLLSEASASSHFRPFFLGNGDNQWTPLKLAEAYARIATNHRTQLRMISQPSAPNPAEILQAPAEKQRLGELIGSLSLQRGAPWVRPYLPAELQSNQDLMHLDGYNLRMLSKTGTALRGEQYRDSAVFAAVFEPYRLDEKPDSLFAKRGVAVIVMIADSPAPGSAAASRNAVRLFAQVWPQINALLKQMAQTSGGTK